MSLFTKILEKLGIRKDAPEPASTTTTAKPAPGRPAARPGAPSAKPATRGPARPTVGAPTRSAAPMSEVDVVKKLDQLSSGKGLNWKVSIVDLLKLLDLDSSREARNELAKELGAPAEVMTDSARMNTWLHKEVLRRIAANGGNIPRELLD